MNARGLLAGTALCAFLGLPIFSHGGLPSRKATEPGYRYYPSPESWTGARMYYVMTDRFFDGNPDNNRANRVIKPEPFKEDGLHGGDFKGIEEKLEYIKQLGADTICLSPVLKNLNAAYHGSHTINFTEIAEQFGGLTALQELIDKAHQEGLYVVLDVVFNHLGPVLDSQDPGYPRFSQRGYNVSWAQIDEDVAPPFNDLGMYNFHGNIQNWYSKKQVEIGSLNGLADLKTSSKPVRDQLIWVYTELIAATDCDGFRVRSAGHIAKSDWDAILPDIQGYCGGLGKKNFLLIGHPLQEKDEEVAGLAERGLFNSMMNLPLYATMISVFVEDAPPANLQARMKGLEEYDEPARSQLVAFLDHDDAARILSKDLMNENYSKLRPALGYLLLGSDFPMVYYGLEQGFNGTGEHYNREDMFDGSFEFGPSMGDNFNPTHPVFIQVRRLNMLRAAYPVFQRGLSRIVYADAEKPGLLVLSRENESMEILQVFNTGRLKTEALPSQVTSPRMKAGQTWINLLNEQERFEVTQVEGDLGLTVPIEGYGVKVLVPEEKRMPVAPTVMTCIPGHDRYRVSDRVKIKLEFDRPMDKESVEKAFRMVPALPGAFVWEDNDTALTFVPRTTLQGDQQYLVQIRKSAASRDGAVLGSVFESRFDTGLPPADEKPLGNFIMDGALDEGAVLLARHGELSLYGAYDPVYQVMYLATQDAGEGQDRVIFIDRDLKVKLEHDAPLNKDSKICMEGPFLMDENDNDFAGWRRVGTAACGAATGLNGGVLEGVLNLKQYFGSVPSRVYLSVASYDTEDRGKLVNKLQVPAPEAYDGNISLDEFFRYVIRDRSVTQ